MMSVMLSMVEYLHIYSTAKYLTHCITKSHLSQNFDPGTLQKFSVAPFFLDIFIVVLANLSV